jgi:hypothetical protein
MAEIAFRHSMFSPFDIDPFSVSRRARSRWDAAVLKRMFCRAGKIRRGRRSLPTAPLLPVLTGGFGTSQSRQLAPTIQQ